MSALLLMLFEAGRSVASPFKTDVRLIFIDVSNLEMFCRANYSLCDIFVKFSGTFA